LAHRAEEDRTPELIDRFLFYFSSNPIMTDVETIERQTTSA
jgi:hypothetical protein